MTKTLLDLEKDYGNFYAPAFSIEIDGADIKGQGAEVAGVSVDLVLGAADQFSFSVNNPYNVEKGEFKWLEGGLFGVNKEVKIKVGYGSRLEPVLWGLVTSLKATFPAGGACQLEISGYSLMHKMMKGKKSPPPWNDKKDSEVVTEVAGTYGFGLKVEDSRVSHPQVKQDKESDYDFIKKLADRSGFEFMMDAEKNFYFRPPALQDEPAVSLQWGKTLSSFTPEINIAEQVTEVKVMGWDPASKKEIVGKASRSGAYEGQEPSTEEVRKPVYTQAQADAMAKAVLDKISSGMVKGSGECIGLPLIRPGLTVQLESLGAKFSKIYYVEKATHAVGTSGYKTTFNVRENSV